MKKKSLPSPLSILSGGSDKKEKEKDGKKSKGKGRFSETNIKHHGDGSHTVRHTPMEPEGGPEISYARPNLSGVISGLRQHLAPEEEGEGEK